MLSPASLVVLGALVAAMTVLWAVSLVRRDASIIDVFWGPAFILAAWLYGAVTAGTTWRGPAVLGLVTVWGLRLALHIFWRNRGKGEDFRYAEMRRRHGRWFALRSLVVVFWLQAVIAWIVSWPLLQVQQAVEPAGLTALDAVGLVGFVIGWLFETVGDWQLARFKADPANRGRIMDRGLWRYTRHPNYFGDALLWWGLTAIALSTPGAWWTLVSPVVMTVLLMKVSGVALLEQSMDDRPGYREYAARTNAFVPWFPRRG